VGEGQIEPPTLLLKNSAGNFETISAKESLLFDFSIK
jgi:hypothetical protein